MKTARLFRNGRSQAVRLPKEMRFDSVKEVTVRREGKSVILEPVEEFSWEEWWSSWKPFGKDFLPKGRQQPRMQKRDFSFD
ncbi:type II toxin-antitoxin system VapB family antitoxin [bacterium]|nr:type II toxin-antitoxin system VapB family antitoxin [bacterium]MCI0602344.1 type II toxin-antitoxin system VapB family antitoxin [bacterium]